MLHIEATEKFIKLYRKLPRDIQERTQKTLELFQKDPAYPSLCHKKMSGQENIYELPVSQNYRITYQKVGNTAYLRKIGTHDLLQHP
ncbi:MAG: hypothetical protein EXS63_09250 [Candidatus Omnitrophica bacterium]|nr:hypothetical protein [Candidatus Omnitrophota bacterium]